MNFTTGTQRIGQDQRHVGISQRAVFVIFSGPVLADVEQSGIVEGRQQAAINLVDVTEVALVDKAELGGQAAGDGVLPGD